MKSVIEFCAVILVKCVLFAADLVPKENVERWLKYLRNEFPTIAFKASTQTQANRLVSMSQKCRAHLKYLLVYSEFVIRTLPSINSWSFLISQSCIVFCEIAVLELKSCVQFNVYMCAA